MWRQVFVICLLITLSDLWERVQAKTQGEPMHFENLIDKINQIKERNYASQPEQSAAESEVNNGVIAKDVLEPSDTGTGTSGTIQAHTGGGTKTNDTGKEKSQHIHGTALPAVKTQPHEDPEKVQSIFSSGNTMFIVIVAASSVAGLIGIIMAGVCWYKFNRNAKAASEVEYPAYGVTGPNKERIPSPGDRKLAQSAQMYHYQHQKQQMIAMEKANGEMKHDASDEESEEENEEGDYTVYECPGLAPTGEMEVKNPLFSDETPVTPGTGEDHKDGGN